MFPTHPMWLMQLREQALKHGLPHLDLLINATGLDYPLTPTLAPLLPQPDMARLLESTPEHALADQGPILLRLHWNEREQLAWLTEFLAQVHRQSRVLVLLSQWHFSELAGHLRHYTQAVWNQGNSSGLLRYWEPRLFLASSETLNPAQSSLFHAPAITWHWIDRDGRASQLPGHPSCSGELPRPRPHLELNHEQVAQLVAWTSAELFRQDSFIQPQDYGLAQQESLIRHLVHAQLAANREQLHDLDQREAFIRQWLSDHSAISPGNEGWA